MSYSEQDVKFAKQAWTYKEENRRSNKVAALVVSPKMKIIGRGLSKLLPGTRYVGLGYGRHVVHAERNAISGRNVGGCTMYVTRFPCEDCARLIVDNAMTRVVYVENDPFKSHIPAHEIFESADIPCVRVPRRAFGP